MRTRDKVSLQNPHFRWQLHPHFGLKAWKTNPTQLSNQGYSWHLGFARIDIVVLFSDWGQDD